MYHFKEDYILQDSGRETPIHALTISKFSWAFFSVPQFGAHIREPHVQAGLPGPGCSPGISWDVKPRSLTVEALPHGPHSPEKAVNSANDTLGKLCCGKQGIHEETCSVLPVLYRTRFPASDKQKHPQVSSCSALQPLPDTLLPSVLGNFLCLL